MSEKRKVSVDEYKTYPASHEDTFVGDDIFGLYRHDTKRYPLLNADEMASLAEQVQAGIIAQTELDISNNLRATKKRKLIEIAENGIAARNAMVTANTGLVFEPAKRRMGRGVDKLDLMQEGNLSLIRAAEKFDPNNSKKSSFGHYALTWIRSGTAQAVHDMGHAIRIPAHHGVVMDTMSAIERDHESTGSDDMTMEELAVEMKRPVEEIKELTTMAWGMVSVNFEQDDSEGRVSEAGEKIFDPMAPSVEDLVIGSDDQEFFDEVREMLANSKSLTPLEKEIVWLKFAVGESSKMVAEEVSRTFGSVGQLASKALLKLRVELEEAGTADHFNRLRRNPR